MRTSEVLNRAADHMERFGHWKGSGTPLGSDPFTAPVCTVAAINRATWGTDTHDEDAEAARHALRRHVRDRCSDIVSWNDAPERTATEVIEAFRACAVIEAAKEDARVDEVSPA